MLGEEECYSHPERNSRISQPLFNVTWTCMCSCYFRALATMWPFLKAKLEEGFSNYFIYRSQNYFIYGLLVIFDMIRFLWYCMIYHDKTSYIYHDSSYTSKLRACEFDISSLSKVINEKRGILRLSFNEQYRF